MVFNSFITVFYSFVSFCSNGRVHHFTKVEMFGVTANQTGKESEQLYGELVGIQEEMLRGLGLHGQVGKKVENFSNFFS